MSDNGTLPVGTILSFGGPMERIPAEYLLCDGRPLKIDSYPALHEAIGFSWGGDPENGRFFLPDLRGIFIRGADLKSGNDPDANSRYLQGDPAQSDQEVGSWQNADLMNHQHTWNHFFYLITKDGEDIAVAQPQDSPNLSDRSGPITIRDGGNPGNETRPINAAVTYIIYAGA